MQVYVYIIIIIYDYFPSLAQNMRIWVNTFYSGYIRIMYKQGEIIKLYKGYTYLFESTYQPYFLVRIPLPEPRLVGRWRVTPGRSQPYTSLMQLPAQHHPLRYKVGHWIFSTSPKTFYSFNCKCLCKIMKYT